MKVLLKVLQLKNYGKGREKAEGSKWRGAHSDNFHHGTKDGGETWLNVCARGSKVIWVVQSIFTGSTVCQVHFKFLWALEDKGQWVPPSPPLPSFTPSPTPAWGQWALGRRWAIFLLPGGVPLGSDSEEPVSSGDNKHGLQEARPKVMAVKSGGQF